MSWLKTYLETAMKEYTCSKFQFLSGMVCPIVKSLNITLECYFDVWTVIFVFIVKVCMCTKFSYIWCQNLGG